MCGIGGILSVGKKYPNLASHLHAINSLQIHRGPDGQKIWTHPKGSVGFAHQRLKIIDLDTGDQPMSDSFGNTICFNGEIYNYLELKTQLAEYPFRTASDTEVILAAYQKWGANCVKFLRGMFAFAIWNEKEQTLFCARDRFGIKPFYYFFHEDVFYFASEVKALMPFVPKIETDLYSLHDYLVFQFCLEGRTLFKYISQLLPAHTLHIRKGRLHLQKYWDVYYHLDFDHTDKYFVSHLEELLTESVRLHTRSDIPIGSYISGGIDSSIIAAIASQERVNQQDPYVGFTGKFLEGKEYDESGYAQTVAGSCDIALFETVITSNDFLETISKIIYHLDYPIAGPGAFPQYHVAKLASKYRKVVLGGQGGDEIFGGYTRYLIAYFEQCIKAAIEGTSKRGNFIVTYESIIPNLDALKNYQPLLKEFWKEGLFDPSENRYFRLINRAPSLHKEIHWEMLPKDYNVFETFQKIFQGNNVGKESYFDSMTHFDFKTLLPALLHVEDRMSMAHGIESRVPFVDHPVVEFAATMPSDVKFKNGTLKRILIKSMGHLLPKVVRDRKDKMGFPVPLNEWLSGDLNSYIREIFDYAKMQHRPFFNHEEIIKSIGKESKFGRKIWGLLSLELWHQQFHDREAEFKKMLQPKTEAFEYATK